jgi:hypothetical protein
MQAQHGIWQVQPAAHQVISDHQITQNSQTQVLWVEIWEFDLLQVLVFASWKTTLKSQ